MIEKICVMERWNHVVVYRYLLSKFRYMYLFYHIHIYIVENICYGMTVPCGSVSIIVIEILINVPLLPNIYICICSRKYVLWNDGTMWYCIDFCHPNFYKCIFSTIYIYGRKHMCYAKTVPYGSVSIFVIPILIYVSFLPYIYIYGRKISVIERRYHVVVYQYLSSKF